MSSRIWDLTDQERVMTREWKLGFSGLVELDLSIVRPYTACSLRDSYG